jgi:hypothetical protein
MAQIAAHNVRVISSLVMIEPERTRRAIEFV